MKKSVSLFLALVMFLSFMPLVSAGTDAYLVKDLYFTGISGEQLENPLHSCIVNVEVKKQQLRFGNDDVVIVSYATDGTMLGFTTVSGTIGTGETSVFKTLVTIPQDKTLGTVKAYVWNDIMGMQPLSNEFTVEVNEMDDGAEITPPVQEKYIPDTITVYGTVDSMPDVNRYRIAGAYIPVDYSNVYTQSEYEALNARNYAISEYYGIPLKNKNYYGGNALLMYSAIDLTGYLFQSGEFTIAMDDEDNYYILNFQPKKSSDVKEVAADTFETVSFAYDGKIKFGSTKYTLADTVRIYVNGDVYDVVNSSNSGADMIIGNVLSAAMGNVKLVKVSALNYDTIFVETYVMGQVTNVRYSNGITNVKFVPAYNNFGSYNRIELDDADIEEGTVGLTVKLDGREVDLCDLRENDVIAVKTPIYVGKSVIDGYCGNITVLASRQTISGRVTSIENGAGENSIVINGEEYSAVDKFNVGMAIGEAYGVIYLDAFGRIFSYDDESVMDDRTYAILARVADRTDITLVLPDGTRKTYEAKNNDIYPSGTKALEISGTTDKVTADSNVLNCVVEYTVKNGQIYSITPVVGVVFNSPYKEAVSKIGTVGISGMTNIINTDAVSYRDYRAMSANDLIDEDVYVGAGFGKIGASSNYSLVVLTKAGFTYNKNSRFAVVNTDQWSQGLDADGDEVDQLEVIVNGEKTTLSFKNRNVYYGFNYGDAFFYHVDSDGLVDSVRMLSRSTIETPGDIDLSSLFGYANYDSTKWSSYLYDYYSDIKLVKGLVVGKASNAVRLLPTPKGYDAPVDFYNFEQFELADNCQVYTYDTDYDTPDEERLDEAGELVAMNYRAWTITEEPDGNNASYAAWDIGKVAWGFTPTVPADLEARGINVSRFDDLKYTTVSDYAQYALAMIVDDKVVEIYEILGEPGEAWEEEEPITSDENYAILARVADRTDITLILPDGTRKAYEAKNNDIYPSGTKALEISGTTDMVTADSNVLNCVVTYTVKDGQIDSITPVAGVAFYDSYRAAASRIGTVGIGSTTGIINTDAVSYRDYRAMSANDLIDDEVYLGAGFGKIGTTSNYSLVVLTVAGFTYNKNSRFAVVNADSWSQGLDADGDVVDQLKVLVNGEKTTLNFKNRSLYYGFNYGDAFFYHVDSDGLVDEVKPISLYNITTAEQINLNYLFGSGNYDVSKWENNMMGSKDIKLVKGLVVRAVAGKVGLVETPTGDAPADFDDFEQFKLADDCLIYTYDSDYAVPDKDKLDEKGSLVAMHYKDWTITEMPDGTNSAYTVADIGKVAWGFRVTSMADLVSRGIKSAKFDTLESETLANYAQYALALIVDDEVVEIYEILAN